MRNNLNCHFSFRVNSITTHTLEELETKVRELTADGRQLISLTTVIVSEEPSKI